MNIPREIIETFLEVQYRLLKENQLRDVYAATSLERAFYEGQKQHIQYTIQEMENILKTYKEQ